MRIISFLWSIRPNSVQGGGGADRGFGSGGLVTRPAISEWADRYATTRSQYPAYRAVEGACALTTAPMATGKGTGAFSRQWPMVRRPSPAELGTARRRKGRRRRAERGLQGSRQSQPMFRQERRGASSRGKGRAGAGRRITVLAPYLSPPRLRSAIILGGMRTFDQSLERVRWLRAKPATGRWTSAFQTSRG